jgi:hypothetical protein
MPLSAYHAKMAQQADKANTAHTTSGNHRAQVSLAAHLILHIGTRNAEWGCRIDGGIAYSGIAYGGILNSGIQNGGIANDGGIAYGDIAQGGIANGSIAYGDIADGGIANGSIAYGGIAYGGIAEGSTAKGWIAAVGCIAVGCVTAGCIVEGGIAAESICASSWDVVLTCGACGGCVGQARVPHMRAVQRQWILWMRSAHAQQRTVVARGWSASFTAHVVPATGTASHELSHTKERARGTGALGIADDDRFEPNTTLSARSGTRLRPLGRGAAALTKRARTLGRNKHRLSDLWDGRRFSRRKK